MSVSEMLTRINNHFDDSQNDVYAESIKIGWIDAAQKDLAEKLPVDFLQKLVQSSKQNTVASTTGSYLYELPTTYFKMVEVLYNKIPCKPCKLSRRMLINLNFDYMATETQPIAVIRDRKVEIFPSLQTISNGLEIIYIIKPYTLISSIDEIQLTEYSELIYNYSLAQGYGRDNLPEATQYLALYINGILEKIGGR